MMNLEQQLELVRKDVRNLALIEKPFEEVQLESVSINEKAILLIKNPCDVAFIKAIKLDHTLVKYIDINTLTIKQNVLAYLKHNDYVGQERTHLICDLLDDRVKETSGFTGKLKLNLLSRTLKEF